MSSAYTLKQNISRELANQTESIVSKTIHADDLAKIVIMALDAGQELSDHAASTMAIIHLLEGDARVTLADDRHDLSAGAWIHMTPGLRHAVLAMTPCILLLTIFKSARA